MKKQRIGHWDDSKREKRVASFRHPEITRFKNTLHLFIDISLDTVTSVINILLVQHSAQWTQQCIALLTSKEHLVSRQDVPITTLLEC